MLATFLATALGGYAAATVLPEGLGTAGVGAAVSLVAGLTCLRFLALRLGPEHALSRSAGRLPILGRWLSPERTLPARTEHRDAA
jgi:hypothetical protein